MVIRWVLTAWFFSHILLAGSVQTVAVYSVAMDTTLNNIVVLPDRDELSVQMFPAIYLLHGWSGSYEDWIRETDLIRLADEYRVIIICPEGGYAGWYLDSPVNGKNRFTTYVGRELADWIDETFPTRKERTFRAITGLSMGGHGALYIAGQFPTTFAGAGSMSGVLDLTQTRFADDIRLLMGLSEIKDLIPYSVSGNIAALKNISPVIIIDCGVDDAFITANREVHQAMIRDELPHTYIERPGGHSWNYWTNALEYHILFFIKELNWPNR